MATFTGLNTMVRGIYVNQLSLNTVGHNIVNADTEGYSRQAVNPVATPADYSTKFALGTGVDVVSLTRARDTYADVQFRAEISKQGYYEAMAKNYDKVEAIFNDSTDSGIENAMKEFYKSWLNLSTSASDSASRVAVVEKGKILSDTMKTASQQLRDQIEDKYDELAVYVRDINQILSDIAEMNGTIVAKEAAGLSANDLRDQRDVLADKLSEYVAVSVHETSVGSYEISTGGVTLVAGVDRLHLAMSNGVASSKYGVDYGVVDYEIKIEESDIAFKPQTGILKAQFDSIDECKEYIDNLSNMAAYMMTTLNDVHKQGYDLRGELKEATDQYGDTVYNSDGTKTQIPNTVNFFGESNVEYIYNYDSSGRFNYVTIKEPTGIMRKDEKGEIVKLTGVQLLSAMQTNAVFEETGGYRYIAAATAYDTSENFDSTMTLAEVGEHLIEWGDRTADGTNAVYISELFNMNLSSIISEKRIPTMAVTKYLGTYDTQNAIGGVSFNSYYQSAMAQLGVDSNAMDTNISQQDIIMNQIENWRDSTNGVDWNEELGDMIKFQKGFGACSRCLSAMDECLERLVNSTGAVGR